MKLFETKYSFFLLLFFMLNTAFAQSLDMKKGSFLFPRIIENKEYVHQFSLILAKLPEEQIESASAWIYSPIFTYDIKYGILYNFNLKGKIATNIITFNFRGGAQWNYEYKRFSFGIYGDLGYWTGKLEHFGFDSRVHAWSGYGGASLGVAFEKFTLTIKGETEYIFSLKEYADDIESLSGQYYAGTYIGMFIEQPLWKDNFVTLGVKMNFSKLYWPAWAVFPTWERYFFIPEAYIGFVL